MNRPDHEHPHDRHPELVAASADGRVTRCRDCGALQVRFGNALLHLDASDLEPLTNAVRITRRKSRDSIAALAPRDARVVELYIGESGVGFAFSRDEIAELEHLLADAERRIASGAVTWTLPEPIKRRIERFPNATS